MDKLNKYQDFVIEYLHAYAARSRSSSMPEVASHVIIDREGNHFQFLRVGWKEKQYIFAVILHFEIKNEKIWIQQNNTEQEIVDVLMEKGVPPEDIVLGFRSPYARQFTGLGVG